MVKYMIHACPERLWYVNDFLIPSMLQQGIHIDNIVLYVDNNKDGCLESTMKSFATLKCIKDGTWHLQDDIIICSDFKNRTERLLEYNYDVICGIRTKYDECGKAGEVNISDMWFSFPCIYLNNNLAGLCSDWYYNDGDNYDDKKLIDTFRQLKRHDDALFKIFLEANYPELTAYHTIPNLVNHIDYLIGGTTINFNRPDKVTAVYWKDDDLVDALKKEIDKH